MREDAQNQSIHFVQVYAVKDRIDFSAISDAPPMNEKNIYSILPTSDEYQTLKENMAILVARILVDLIPFFSEDYKGLVTRHIPHQYSTQMTLKSEVVSFLFSLVKVCAYNMLLPFVVTYRCLLECYHTMKQHTRI